MSDYFPPPNDSAWDLIAPDLILPSQLERSRTHENDVTRIAVRTFQQAIEDVKNGCRCIDTGADRGMEAISRKRLVLAYRDAINWFNDDIKAGFSFLNLCEYLGLENPMKIRDEMNKYRRDTTVETTLDEEQLKLALEAPVFDATSASDQLAYRHRNLEKCRQADRERRRRKRAEMKAAGLSTS